MKHILMVGDIVGSPGRTVFANTVTRLRAAGRVDFVVANGENAAGGSGITQALAEELFAAGADVLTLGDHCWRQRQLVEEIDRCEHLLRPANFPPGNPGRGMTTVRTDWGAVTVINLIGRVFMDAVDCPFRAADALLKQRPAGGVVLVDFHAEATSEKIAMGRYLDGRAAAIVGTHTHVQTSDERVSDSGTATITDLGMTGAADSVLGREVEPVLKKFLTGMPARFDVAAGDARLEGVIVSVDERSGRARRIKRIRESAGNGG